MQPRRDQSASRLLSEAEPQQPVDKVSKALGPPPIPGGQSQKVTIRSTDSPKASGVCPRKPAAGIVLECTAGGTILEVTQDELGLTRRILPGASLLNLVDRGNLGKALAFLAEMKSCDLAFGWELTLSLGGKFIPLLFAGVTLNGRLLIAGSRSRSGLAHLIKHVMEPARVSGIDPTIKEPAASTQTSGDPDLAVYDELSRANQELLRLQSELAGKNAELKRLNGELQAAQAEVKTLQGFLPICTSCKKIRDDQGYWNQIEQYFHAHTGVGFTHSICPECLKTLYPDLYPKK